MVSDWAAPTAWDALPVMTRREAAAAVTATLRRSAPAALIVPSFATMVADSALYSFIVPEATPVVNVRDVLAAPKFWSTARRSRKVGAVTGLVELEAPVKVSVWLPV